MELDYVQLISRWLHITAAVTAAGGAMFMKFALHPASQTLPDDARTILREAVRSRWAKVVMSAITVLLATGFFNFVTIIKKFDLPKPYHPIFGVKFLLAMAVFFLASVLVGRSDLARRMRADAGKWLSLLVGMVLVLLFLSSMLRGLPHDPKGKAAPGAAAPGAATSPTAASTPTAR